MRRSIDRVCRITGDRASHAEYGVGPANDYGVPDGARVIAPFAGRCYPTLTLTGGPGVMIVSGDWQFHVQHMGADRADRDVREGEDVGYITRAGTLWDGYHQHAFVIAAGTRLAPEEFFAACGYVSASFDDIVQPTLTAISGSTTEPFTPAPKGHSMKGYWAEDPDSGTARHFLIGEFSATEYDSGTWWTVTADYPRQHVGWWTLWREVYEAQQRRAALMAGTIAPLEVSLEQIKAGLAEQAKHAAS